MSNEGKTKKGQFSTVTLNDTNVSSINIADMASYGEIVLDSNTGNLIITASRLGSTAKRLLFAVASSSTQMGATYDPSVSNYENATIWCDLKGYATLGFSSADGTANTSVVSRVAFF